VYTENQIFPNDKPFHQRRQLSLIECEFAAATNYRLVAFVPRRSRNGLLQPADRFGPCEIRTANYKFLSYEELLDALDKITERITQDGASADITEHA
jgi:hypothetical protein